VFSRRIDRTLPVLDFGSSTGNVVKYLSGAGLETVAMDVSLEMLRENRAQNRVVAESQYLPFRDGCFGMIAACSVFHHLPNQIKAIQEICRVVAPHSVILIPHEPVASLKTTLLVKLVYSISWLLWRLNHPKALKSLLSYIFFHRNRLRKLQASLKHIESDLDLDYIKEMCSITGNHSFKVQITFFSKGFRLEARR
jgi:SAM-dependent methyltransferase